jgi:cytochrome c oxidase subunit 2
MIRWIPGSSSFAPHVDFLFWLILIVVGVWFLAAEAMFFWLMFRFRARPGVPARYITGKEKDLKRWINIPHALVLVCDIVIIVAAVRLWVEIKQTLPPADETVRVIGQQWTWTFDMPGPDGILDTPDDIHLADEMHVQVGKTYHVLLESKDVLHSFSVPAFRLKQDVVPGRIITSWFKATRTGTHDIQCTQMCGIGHGIMRAAIVIETPQEHAAWLEKMAAIAASAP